MGSCAGKNHHVACGKPFIDEPRQHDFVVGSDAERLRAAAGSSTAAARMGRGLPIASQAGKGLFVAGAVGANSAIPPGVSGTSSPLSRQLLGQEPAHRSHHPFPGAAAANIDTAVIRVAAETVIRWGLVLCQRGEMSSKLLRGLIARCLGPKVRRLFAGGDGIRTLGSAPPLRTMVRRLSAGGSRIRTLGPPASEFRNPRPQAHASLKLTPSAARKSGSHVTCMGLFLSRGFSPGG